jgi:hypothetical protein
MLPLSCFQFPSTLFQFIVSSSISCSQRRGSVLTVLFPIAEHHRCLRSKPANEPMRDAADRIGGGRNQTFRY